ncbi:sensor histidine kinase [Myxacorys almedinensis]|uniref:sensor histidine kinase n=1 Tax=Myxacorys almedinensis TaxID=2651157 RepID=UPI001EE47D5C|nr:HAMP domain-containing sensor histidine kinase [Myxacorys almedinensis]
MSIEYLTPPEYVVGYLYIGGIVLTSNHLRRRETFLITLIAAFLTLSNLWFPVYQLSQASTIVNRAIVVMALIVTSVISDRNRHYQAAIAQQQLRLHAQEQLASLREDFVSTLTHDLKTPLLGAIETLKAMQRAEFGAITPTQQTVFTTMQRSHQTTLQLVEMMLDIYRNDADGLTLKLQPIELGAIAQDAMLTLRELAAARRVHLSLNYSDSGFRQSLWAMGDALQLRRVFSNLITNSIHHSPRGASVEIWLESRPSHQVVKVLDAGLGVAPEELPHLFERFYQGQSDRQATGSGLGLYLSRQIIEAHSGKIWAENRVPNGAIFAFRLPTISP